MTSTTATMAIGDALAAALMERRGFGREKFRAFHPGGKLGASLSTAAEIMHCGEALPLVSQGTSVTEAIHIMSEKRFGCVGVVDGQRRLVGIFTDGDLRRAVLGGIALRAVDDIMSCNPQRIDPDTLLVDVARLMQARAIPSVFVTTAEGAPLGLIHLHDLLRARLV
jgi:arabinose-5-phosphate isomerase